MNPLTDAEFADLQSIVGARRRVWPAVLRAEPHAVARFALGVGDDNPLWCDPWEISAVPPPFLYAGVNFGSYPQTGLPSGTRRPTITLWMRDKWDWHRPVLPGEWFSASSEIALVEERIREGRRQGAIVTEVISFVDSVGEPLALLERSTITMPRLADGVAASPVPQPPGKQDLARLARSYANEASFRRGGEPRWWDDLAMDDELAPIAKGPLTVTSLVGFAMGWGAPLCPTNRALANWVQANPDATVRNLRTGWPEGPEGIHWDPDVYGAFGYDLGFDFGPQRISWAAHLITDWCGDNGRLTALDSRLLKPNFLGDITWFGGNIVALHPVSDREGEAIVAIEGVNHRGETTTAATARVRLPRRPISAHSAL
ncbi:hypothetical protein HGI47_21450 [Novosphingobium sp. ERN07]|uniref:hypothetical protein n=1 Tax=Novosphingobium sp. ERN07 TaxID=2726187 RepID=UPI0014568720|nr:hypothetical protein [Novosphingobium sp. ERN07]NLR73432.1 hypothetical protein [Novosphingobium sp. ERN07]